jgi:hypothetical protein
MGSMVQTGAGVASERVRQAGGWGGLLTVLAGAFGRAVCPAEPFPWWEADPFLFAPPIVGITPTWALALNLVIVLGSALVLACVRGGPGRAGTVLLALGMGVVGWHAITDLETVPDGADLAASMAAIVGVWAGSALPGARRVVVGVALGFGVMLAVVGAQQMYIEHPRTVESFQRTSAEFYQAKGWDPDGPEAAMYEERLSHAEPTGWFGLTNVLATFAGASAVGLITLALGKGPRAVRLAFVAGGVASAWTLMTTVSKGAIGAAALAGLLVAVAWGAQRFRPWVGRVVLAGAGLVVLAVLARGAVGERMGERSLLFRSQYMRGTVSVWAERPVVGIGPGQFQDAYTRLKPPRAPEEVTSPHSVGFDWVGLLGLGGLAWVGLLACGYGRRTDEQGPDAEGPSSRRLARGAVGVVGVGVLTAAFAGRAAIVPESAAALLIGGIGWCVVAALVCIYGGTARAAALAGGAVALLHGQLDLTPVWTVSAPAWGVLIGMGIGAVGVGPPDRVARGFAVAALVGMAGVLGLRLGGLAAWEAGLSRAAEWPRLIATARTDLAVAEEMDDQVRITALADRVQAWMGGGQVPPRADAVRAALDQATLGAQETVLDGLRDAVAARPGHIGTRSALGRVLVTIASRDRSAAAWREALQIAEQGTHIRPQDPGAWSWLGAMLEQGATIEPGNAPGWLKLAADAWTEGDRLTPHAPGSAARIAEVLDRAGQSEAAAAWAVRALGRDDGLDLDPRRRLSEARRGALEAIARGDRGGGASPGP